MIALTPQQARRIIEEEVVILEWHEFWFDWLAVGGSEQASRLMIDVNRNILSSNSGGYSLPREVVCSWFKRFAELEMKHEN